MENRRVYPDRGREEYSNDRSPYQDSGRLSRTEREHERKCVHGNIVTATFVGGMCFVVAIVGAVWLHHYYCKCAIQLAHKFEVNVNNAQTQDGRDTGRQSA